MEKSNRSYKVGRDDMSEETQKDKEEAAERQVSMSVKSWGPTVDSK